MSDPELLAAATDGLRGYLESIVGPGAIPRFEEALTHPSFANEAGVPDNQRLEFLGDAVLGLCVSEVLAAAHTDADEGKLTRMRSALVNAAAIASWARRVGLGDCIRFGRGAKSGGEREQTNVLADAVEALVAAVYEARGLSGARSLVRDIVGALLEKAEALSVLDSEERPPGASAIRGQARSDVPRLGIARGGPRASLRGRSDGRGLLARARRRAK